jgi:hypothetical protein
MKTYDRDTFLRARRLWDEGEFGWQWQAIRRQAAERGFIFPPNGTIHDDREAENPSQRAVVWRALQDNPTRLTTIVSRSRSWNDVVRMVIGMEDTLRVDADELARDEAWSRRDDPDHREAITSLARILERIEEAR